MVICVVNYVFIINFDIGDFGIEFSTEKINFRMPSSHRAIAARRSEKMIGYVGKIVQ